MSGQVSQRGGDAAFEGSLVPNEKVLRDVHQLYLDEDNGNTQLYASSNDISVFHNKYFL